MNTNPTRGLTTPRIRVTEVGEFVRYASCGRRLKLGFDGDRLARSLPFYGRLMNSLDPVLRESGRVREDEVEEQLQEAGYADALAFAQLRRQQPNAVTSFQSMAQTVAAALPGTSLYFREVVVSAQIGAFVVEGRADYVLLEWAGGAPKLRVIEIKASRRDHTYHRIQAAIYQLAFRHAATAGLLTTSAGVIDPANILAIVARIDEGTETIQRVASIGAFDLTVEESDVKALLAEGGIIQRIVRAELDEVAYQLDQKCDGCRFSINCLPEAARARSLSLLGLSAGSTQALLNAGVDTIDRLADIDPQLPVSRQIRQAPGFSEHLEALVQRASARRTTLPGGGADPDEYQVMALPNVTASHIPAHEISGVRLVRVYMSVDYDYVENRIGALTAHVTSSENEIYTPFAEVEAGRFRPAPRVVEVPRADRRNWAEVGTDIDPRSDVIVWRHAPWPAESEQAARAEQDLIGTFFRQLSNAIARAAAAQEVPVHFYFWTRSEVSRLVEACSRSGLQLLSSLQDLMGCREELEQLIYSCLQSEVENRYGLGWTGRGLSVVSSLRWFGQRYHWVRAAGAQTFELDRLFEQDIFDFKSTLFTNADGTWAERGDNGASSFRFEVRSRFFDTLPAPYWRAAWGSLTPPTDPKLTAQERTQLERYYRAGAPNALEEYLRARVHALRWIEGFLPKNPDISKPLLNVARLTRFVLAVDTTRRAALDFLRLDYLIERTDWVGTGVLPVVTKACRGISLPIRDVRASGGNGLTAGIWTEAAGLELEQLRERWTHKVGDFVRLVGHGGDPNRGQTVAQLMRLGCTCIISQIDWEAGRVRLDVIPSRAGRYVLNSFAPQQGAVGYPFATLESSITAFVSKRVDDRLDAVAAHHCYQWFDPTEPDIPDAPELHAGTIQLCRQALSAFQARPNERLDDDQLEAIVGGLSSRVQLLQGPPGTGKTHTTGIATLVRACVLNRESGIVLVAANTHNAVDQLTGKIAEIREGLLGQLQDHGIVVPTIAIIRLDANAECRLGPDVLRAESTRVSAAIRDAGSPEVCIVAGTTNAILKAAGALGRVAQADGLVVDEASMMVFPHFLALATCVADTARILLAGDHRQLSPIVSHDWEGEDRPPVLVYQPYTSAFDALRRIKSESGLSNHALLESRLSFSFRLPRTIRRLIQPVYSLDNIVLRGPDRDAAGFRVRGADPISAVWDPADALSLVVHDEAGSAKGNLFEVDLIVRALAVGPELGDRSVAIVTPYRLQREFLQRALAHDRRINVIDTVEKLQGDECPVVFVSACASSPTLIGESSEFILDLNRSNVAFSRVKEKLIVVCSRTLLDYVPNDFEIYQSAMLWKALRELCVAVRSVHVQSGVGVRCLAVEHEA